MTRQNRRSFLLMPLREAGLGIAAVLALALGHAAYAQHDRFQMRVIQSGHSLTDPIVPVLNGLIVASGAQARRPQPVTKSTIPGSPMDWRWDHRADPVDARHDIADYDLLVLTERVSLSNTMPWHDSEAVALRWVEHAWTNGAGGAGAPTVLYASWVDVTSSPEAENPHGDPEAHIPFRDRLDLEMARWQQIADHVNENLPDGAPAMRVIPGPLVMAAVHDAIEAGQAPGLSTMQDLFEDTIHVNRLGAYLIALAHYGTIYGADPRDLPDALGGLGPRDPAMAAWMQDVVHQVLLDYPGSGYGRD
ncbi:MAG: hypothetical protein P3W94_004715 [Paracoccus sp. (in: a-proteobacteria)]|nr:hypothetical protein [Paracoccus sp. (in: a-proteobacteria)]